MDYKKLGFKAGVEIHQQLDTHKLFCNCNSEVKKTDPEGNFNRRLHATASELGTFDRASLQETQARRSFEYNYYLDTDCLVELDEEPPHEINPDALQTVIQISMLLGAEPVDELHVMRKEVVDGSNTAGFQRTILASMEGKIDSPEGQIAIPFICLEEDAARIEERGSELARYRIDRLGIPLVEIATSPDIKNPKHGGEVAAMIGKVLRSCKIKRGLGTIRQDVNVSIRDGARVEIKGVQSLDMIPTILEQEVNRQLALVEIREELKKRKASKSSIKPNPTDLSSIFKKTECKILKGKTVLGIKLENFAGLVGKEIAKDRRLGTEFSDHAKVKASVKGIFHSDELPKYGITQADVDQICKKLNCKKNDSFVLVGHDKKKVCEDAISAVVNRAQQCFIGVPKETRRALEEGNSSYMRPLPGASRMYPETDVPPVVITDQLLKNVKSNLPELVHKKEDRFVKSYKLSRQLAAEVVDSGWADLFEKSVKELKIEPSVAANALTSETSALRREGIEVDNLTDEQIYSVFNALSKKKISKEAIPEIFTALVQGKTLETSLKKTGGKVSGDDLDKIVQKIVKSNQTLIKQQGDRAFQPLMGLVMKEVRGKVDGALVAKALKKHLKK